MGPGTAARLPPTGHTVVHPATVRTIRGGVSGVREHWEVPGRARRGLLASSVGPALPAIARTAGTLGLTVSPGPGMLDLVDPRGGRGLDRLFHRLARELTGA